MKLNIPKVLELELSVVTLPMSLFTRDYVVSKDHVELKWKNSASENIASHRVYRKQLLDNNEALWENVYETSNIHNLIDTVNKYK